MLQVGVDKAECLVAQCTMYALIRIRVELLFAEEYAWIEI